ncbi:hypothetical protein KFL_004510050 [Klebsormidium nitens]|uniref:Sjoegren syndrome/scleroderma autoantigen 1 n=1 Tax=Klebsormidium nitens TaxID=105231 RepID=A0A1Y1IKQ4_KLENI|nr:hypothetical protein KFL_004510050 [Klebsormidium nitens]|eukprot:GAQ88678.1 hypothetical protein KFL_004510050 [Klebsormidium nitens]
MPGLEDRIDAIGGLGGLELNSPREANGLVADGPGANGQVANGIAAPMEEDLAAEEQRRQRAAQMDRASALIGQRMLQGWAMLDMSCPQCYSPIMRDRQRQLWCVACDMRVVDESQQTATEPAGPSVEREGGAGQAATPKRKTSPEVAREAAMEGNVGEEGREAKRQATDSALTTQLPNHAAAGATNLQSAARTLQSSLVTKVEECREAIQECRDSEELTQLLDLVHKLASTIQAVKGLEQIS